MATSAKKVSRSERLAALRDKLSTTDYGGHKGGWFNPKKGRNVIRLLPEVGEMEFFYQPVGKHELPGKKTVHCPNFTSEGELECPICELVSDLYKAGDNASKELASQIRVKKKFWMNVVARGETDAKGRKTSDDEGPFIFPAGITIFNAISTIIGDPDYGDIMDPETGIDLVIERSGDGVDTSYQVTARRNESPLSDDPDQAQKWLDDAKDLSYVVLSDDPEEDKELIGKHAIWVWPYDRIAAEYDLDNLDEDVEEEPEEEPAPKKSKPAPKPAPAAKAVARKPAKVEEEETEEEEVEEEAEEEEEVPAAKQEVVRRMARRAVRR